MKSAIRSLHAGILFLNLLLLDILVATEIKVNNERYRKHDSSSILYLTELQFDFMIREASESFGRKFLLKS